jgi:hypothetical protein
MYSTTVYRRSHFPADPGRDRQIHTTSNFADSGGHAFSVKTTQYSDPQAYAMSVSHGTPPMLVATTTYTNIW